MSYRDSTAASMTTSPHCRDDSRSRRRRAASWVGLLLSPVPGAWAAGADLKQPVAPAFKTVDTLPRVATPHLNFVTLVVGDFERSRRFYTTVLGLIERGRAMPSAENFEVVMGFDAQPMTPGISLTFRGGAPRPRGNGSSSINLVVRDLAGIMTRVVPAGGKVLSPLQRGESPKVSYSLARIEDPDGNALELVEYHRIG